MDSERRRRLEDVLDSPLDPRGGQTLREAATQDSTLLRDLATVLTDEGGVDAPVDDEPAVRRLTLGDRIGPYRIDRLLGRGGMGIVYKATRQDDYAQQVALKVVEPGHRRAEILRRFYRERQILADLEHPHVARLLGGGMVDDGSPYLAMEFVDGVPIDEDCDRRGASVEERLELFLKVCGAVHFAHRNLIVHRDLKPGNILVTRDVEPKLLDFGIAKILRPDDGRSDSWYLQTIDDRRPMTPAYASPEQLLGQTVTTASDVYALGVLLYQLLAGRLPYDFAPTDRARLVRSVCLEDPLPPSVAAGTAGDQPLARRLAGDLDAVVAKAMHKDPERRYASAAQLADDLRSHLDGRPVAAHPGHWLYTAGKLARRHKLALAVLLLIVVSAASSTILWRQAERARGAAEVEAERAETARARAQQAQGRAEQISSFLEDLFGAADPDRTRGADVTVREILDRGRQQLETSLEETPETRADLAGTLGSVYQNLGLFDTAAELKDEALRLRLEADPADRPDLAIDLNNLARLHFQRGDSDAGEPLLRRALGMWRRLGDADAAATTQLNLAALLTHRGAWDEALALHQEVLAWRRAQNDRAGIAYSLFALGVLRYSRGELDAAESRLREAIELYLVFESPNPTRVASVRANLGLVLHALGQIRAARAELEIALAERRQLLGENHPTVAITRANLAEVHLDLGDLDAAGRLLEPAREVLLREKTPGSWTLGHVESIWGRYRVEIGRTADGVAALEAGHAALLEAKGERDIYTRRALGRLERAGTRD
ncbi:MAG: serine/threonine-protein kinase [Acidobacteriota bacterium]